MARSVAALITAGLVLGLGVGLGRCPGLQDSVSEPASPSALVPISEPHHRSPRSRPSSTPRSTAERSDRLASEAAPLPEAGDVSRAEYEALAVSLEAALDEFSARVERRTVLRDLDCAEFPCIYVVEAVDDGTTDPASPTEDPVLEELEALLESEWPFSSGGFLHGASITDGRLLLLGWPESDPSPSARRALEERGTEHVREAIREALRDLKMDAADIERIALEHSL